MSNSVQPHRWQPIRLFCPWDSPGKNTGVGAISFSNAWKWKLKVKSLSRVWLLVTPRTIAYKAPLSMGFSRQEYWSGVPSPSPETTDDVKRVRPEADSHRETSVGIPTVQWSNTSNPARAITSLPESVHRAQLSPKNKKWKQLQINRGPMKLPLRLPKNVF